MFWLAEVFNGGVSQEEMRRRELWARRERAESVHQVLVTTGRSLAGAGRLATAGLARVAQGIKRGHERRVAIRELQGLSDQTLRDIGISRTEIPTVIEGLMNGKPEITTVAGAVIRPHPGRARATASRQAAREWQRAA